MPRLDRWIALGVALALALLGFLPISNWIPGGYATPGWRDAMDGWWSGTMLAVGIAAVLAILSRRVGALAWTAPLEWMSGAWSRRPAGLIAALAVLAFAAYVWSALSVLSGRPLLIDEIVQVFQARIYAGGALARPAAADPEFFFSLQVLVRDGKVFSQFPAGGPAMLAIGSLLRAEWLVGPLFGAASVVLFAGIARRIEPGPGTALGAVFVFALAPFAVFMSGSHMNHVTGLTWLLVAWTGLVRSMGPGRPEVRWGLVTGLGFGIAALVRPVDAFAFALPAGVLLLVRAWRSGAWPALWAAGVGVLVPVALQLAVNARTTGDPLLFGYTALWGATHGLGFHASPWGEVHSPARGLELLNLYFFRLQSYLLELPLPSLAPAIAALAFTRRLSAFDRYLIVSGTLFSGLYFAYWHDGFYLGPRFMYPLLPFLALWTARAVPRLVERLGPGSAGRAVGFAAVIAVVIGLATSFPRRVREYRGGMLTMRWDADGAADRAGVRSALVFVRESWGAQLVVRMWSVGIRPNDAEHLYRKTDACKLERTLDQIEAQGLSGDSALLRLRPLLADSARLIASPYTSDPTNRVLPGTAYTPECIQRLREDRSGYTLFSPLLLAGRRNDVVYARDLHARDSLLLEEHPDRTVYLLRPATDAVGAPPLFHLLDRDSLMASWRGASP